MVQYLQGGDGEEGGGADKLDMKNVGGVFVVVCFGCLVATILGLARWIIFVRKMAKSIDVIILRFKRLKLRLIGI